MWFIYLSVLQGSDLCLGAILDLVSETKIFFKKKKATKNPPQQTVPVCEEVGQYTHCEENVLSCVFDKK